MSNLNNDLEALIGDMGMSISKELPQETTEAPVQDEPQPLVESVQEEQASVETPQEVQPQEEAVEEPLRLPLSFFLSLYLSWMCEVWWCR